MLNLQEQPGGGGGACGGETLQSTLQSSFVPTAAARPSSEAKAPAIASGLCRTGMGRDRYLPQRSQLGKLSVGHHGPHCTCPVDLPIALLAAWHFALRRNLHRQTMGCSRL